MTRKLMINLQLLVTLVVTLISFSANAQSKATAQGMCSDKISERCVNTAYHEYRQHGNEAQWRKQLLSCEQDYFARKAWWEARYEKYPMSRILGQGPEEASAADKHSCLNTLQLTSVEARIARMDEAFRTRARLAAIEREARRRQESVTRLAVLDSSDIPKPAASSGKKEEPKVPLTDAEAAATIAALSASPPHSESVPIATPPKPYDFQQERYNQWRTAHPEVAAKANKPAKTAAPVGTSGVKINCIPANVSLVKLAENGDTTLFIHAGADITQLHRCFPNHDFDPVKVVNGNIAAATIPYYLEYADRPLNKNKLHFHQGRWRLKRSEWKISGEEFFREFFGEHKGKEFGFALQGGQRLVLSVKSESPAPTNATPESEPNKPAKHGGYKQVQPEEKQLRLASVDFANQPASEYEPAMAEASAELASSSEAELSKASGQNGSNYSDAMLSIPPTGQVILIRAGPRVTRESYIVKQRYRQKGGADLNLSENFVRHQAHKRLPYCEHYGQFAFG
ncbi:MAG: hypothetical protein P1P90_00265 [Patescibacteria group bacterium]|nr:hypothetical protein [Patescibacteria group bacterium]